MVLAVSTVRLGLPPVVVRMLMVRAFEMKLAGTPKAAQLAARLGEPPVILATSQGSSTVMNPCWATANNSPMFGARTARATVPRTRTSSTGAQVPPNFQLVVLPAVE